MRKRKTYNLVGTKDIFIVTMIVITITVIGVYLWGLGHHHTFYQNSIISTTILSVAFFLYVTAGLYKGTKLKDNVGRIIQKERITRDVSVGIDFSSVEPVSVGEGIGGIIISILLWILMAVFFSLLLWLLSNVFVIVILAFAGMLYWIFFRALRLVFKNSNTCKGSLLESMKWGFTYTVLYNFWIYGIIMMTTYLKG
jgi:hypothetical protein